MDAVPKFLLATPKGVRRAMSSKKKKLTGNKERNRILSEEIRERSSARHFPSAGSYPPNESHRSGLTHEGGAG